MRAAPTLSVMASGRTPSSLRKSELSQARIGNGVPQLLPLLKAIAEHIDQCCLPVGDPADPSGSTPLCEQPGCELGTGGTRHHVQVVAL